MLKREKHAADYLDGDVHDCDEGDINNVDEFDNSNDDNSHEWCLLKQNLGLFLGLKPVWGGAQIKTCLENQVRGWTVVNSISFVTPQIRNYPL